VAAISIGCNSGPPPPDLSAQLDEIRERREATERFMRESSESPIPKDKLDTLLPLKYFEPDMSFIVPAELRLADVRPVAEMPTSTGTIARYQRVGVLEFTLAGTPMSLGAFVPEGTRERDINELFVPFADLTTGKDTYNAGRYLNLRPRTTGVYTIDFNQAYNPYCAYNKSYECPFPPPSNRLKIEVRAGEKDPGA
jgi:uncharacterized protein (DUF1684 family)